MDLKEKEVSRKYIHNGRIISLREDDVTLPNGKRAKREVVEHPGGVCVAALTDDRNLLMVRQYRRPFDEVLLEIPAGKLDKGEDHLDCGIRELREETGFSAKHFEYFGHIYPTPGFCDEKIHIYFAWDLTEGDCDPDDDEFLDVLQIPFDEVFDKVIKNEIKDSKTVAAVLAMYARMQEMD